MTFMRELDEYMRDLLKGVKIGTEDECEGCHFVVCGSKSFFDDDVKTTCSHCGTPIVHRPYSPKSPPKICIKCAILQSEAEALPHA